MISIDKQSLNQLRIQYPTGTRVILDKMNDSYNNKLFPGSKGTVVCVDDIGTIHINWDCGSSLGIIYGEDLCHVIINDNK